MTISKDRVKPSPLPDSWKLSEIFATGIVLGSYLALMTVIFFRAAFESTFFEKKFFQVTSLVWFINSHLMSCIGSKSCTLKPIAEDRKNLRIVIHNNYLSESPVF